MSKDLDNALDAAALAKGKPDPSQPVDMMVRDVKTETKHKVVTPEYSRFEVGTIDEATGLIPIFCQEGSHPTIVFARCASAQKAEHLAITLNNAPRLMQREVELMAEVERLKKNLDDCNQLMLAAGFRIDKTEAATKDLLAVLKRINDIPHCVPRDEHEAGVYYQARLSHAQDIALSAVIRVETQS